MSAQIAPWTTGDRPRTSRYRVRAGGGMRALILRPAGGTGCFPPGPHSQLFVRLCAPLDAFLLDFQRAGTLYTRRYIASPKASLTWQLLSLFLQNGPHTPPQSYWSPSCHVSRSPFHSQSGFVSRQQCPNRRQADTSNRRQKTDNGGQKLSSFRSSRRRCPLSISKYSRT